MTTAAVVGSGPNGLAAAIRLAHAGIDVTVFEAHARPGGGTRSSELTVPGLVHDECAAFHPTGVASPFFASLGLERHGLKWLWPEIDLAHPLDDGRAGLAARDRSLTEYSLGQDAHSWHRLFDSATSNFDALIAEVFQPVAHVPHRPVVLGRFGMHALAPATWTARRFRDEPARALFMGVAAHAFSRLDTPLSSSVGMMLTATAHAVGWPVAEGGTESITRALVAELASFGGEVVTGTRITSMDQLREITGRKPEIVVLDTAPQGVLRIVGDELPSRVRRALSRYRYGPAAFKLDLAIDGDIPWINEDCARAGTVHLGGTAAEIVAVERATVRGEMAQRPFVLLGQQYLIDPTRSQGSLNPVYAYAHVPHAYTGDATEVIIGQIERFAPGFQDRIVATSTRSPAALETYNANYVGGDISAGANTARQIAFRPRVAMNPYELGMPGVYLCSSATPPGAGVHGMGGFHAAERALAWLRDVP
ncbi:phytoene desaturase family protein [Nocardia sp. A7]|uniref:phytoene desaturase family protein n=1 Tax=Nocardia sp. A7 TaxID=2789274 RepID=UPI00397AC1C7